MAKEFSGKGANIMLAPGIGIARVPTGGRIFEYLCGEDPYLGSEFAYQSVIGSFSTISYIACLSNIKVPIIFFLPLGIQSQGIMANAKHWINNEIENDRRKVSANVDERTRFEIYYPPFEAAIRAGTI